MLWKLPLVYLHLSERAGGSTDSIAFRALVLGMAGETLGAVAVLHGPEALGVRVQGAGLALGTNALTLVALQVAPAAQSFATVFGSNAFCHLLAWDLASRQNR